MKVVQSCPTLRPHGLVHGILQARIVEWVAFPFSRGSSQSSDWTQVSHIAGGFFTSWATREAQNGQQGSGEQKDRPVLLATSLWVELDSSQNGRDWTLGAHCIKRESWAGGTGQQWVVCPCWYHQWPATDHNGETQEQRILQRGLGTRSDKGRNKGVGASEKQGCDGVSLISPFDSFCEFARLLAPQELQLGLNFHSW